MLIPGKKYPAETGAGVQGEKERDGKCFPSAKVEVVHAKRHDSCIPRDAVPRAGGALLSVNSDGRRRRETTLACDNQAYEN